jgi:hypothetical protein
MEYDLSALVYILIGIILIMTFYVGSCSGGSCS